MGSGASILPPPQPRHIVPPPVILSPPTLASTPSGLAWVFARPPWQSPLARKAPPAPAARSPSPPPEPTEEEIEASVARGERAFQWRKYGEKKVGPESLPRSYYRCTYAECKAKRRVDVLRVDGSLQEKETLIGAHNHLPPTRAERTKRRKRKSRFEVQGKADQAGDPKGGDEEKGDEKGLEWMAAGGAVVDGWGWGEQAFVAEMETCVAAVEDMVRSSLVAALASPHEGGGRGGRGEWRASPAMASFLALLDSSSFLGSKLDGLRHHPSQPCPTSPPQLYALFNAWLSDLCRPPVAAGEGPSLVCWVQSCPALKSFSIRLTPRRALSTVGAESGSTTTASSSSARLTPLIVLAPASVQVITHVSTPHNH